MLNWIQQLTVVLIPLVSAIVSYLTVRKRKQAALQQAQAGHPQSADRQYQQQPTHGPLNGYAPILRDALDRIDKLRDENEAWRVRYDDLRDENGALRRDIRELRERLADCEHERERERQQPKPRTRRTTTSTRRRPAPRED